MDKHDINRNLPMQYRNAAGKGYDRWFHSFIGANKKNGEKKHFFVEYSMLGQNESADQMSLLVRAGYWGKKPVQAEQYFEMKEIEISKNFLKISAGDCFLSENNIWGRIKAEHEIQWSIRLNKRIAFHIGYSTGKLVRRMNPLDMYWHTEGMKTFCEGVILVNGETFVIDKMNSFGYADKKWGRNFTAPWLWLNSSQCKSVRYNSILSQSAFAMGGGDPVVFGIPLKSKPFVQLFLEERIYEINFSKLWTFSAMKYSCREKNGKLFWQIEVKNSMIYMKIDVVYLRNEMINQYFKHGKIEVLSGGTGKGKISLYKRTGRNMILVDKILLKGIGCEYIK